MQKNCSTCPSSSHTPSTRHEQHPSTASTTCVHQTTKQVALSTHPTASTQSDAPSSSQPTHCATCSVPVAVQVRERGYNTRRGACENMSGDPVIFHELPPTWIDEPQAAHPLEPLSVAEIHNSVILVRNMPQFNRQMFTFHVVRLLEPSKQEVWQAEVERKPLERKTFVVILVHKPLMTYELVVSLTQKRVLNVVNVPGIQPSFVSGEYELCQDIVRDDPMFHEFCKKHKLDIDRVWIECWAAGHFSSDDDPTHRLVRPLLFYLSEPDANAYANPIDFVDVLVDLVDKKVVQIHYNGNPEMIPPAGDKHANFGDPWFKADNCRNDLKPLEVIQRDGPSFNVDNHLVTWQRFSFRVGFNQREGMVLHDISYHPPGERKRPIIYRLSFGEMIVPYGDPKPPNVRKNAFDAGEDGLGNSICSLKLGCDCLGFIHYFDVSYVNMHGKVVTVPNAVCLHEEDDGILWKHMWWRTGQVDMRRGRKLVVSFIATVANYDYGFYVIFRQDGTISTEVKMTGIVSTSTLPAGVNTHKYGTVVAPQLNASVHQHFFTARLDMAVDGARCRIEEVDVVAETEGPHNPHKNGFYPVSSLIETEKKSGRMVDHSRARHWVVTSSQRRNRMNHPTAYRLVPFLDVRPFASLDSSVMLRAPHLQRHLWVTNTHPEEIFPTGKYPNQRKGSDGVYDWVQKDRNLVDTDLTVWYTFGLTHVVRPEEWPVMPTEKIGFTLQPFGFFDCNPTLDTHPNPNGQHASDRETHTAATVPNLPAKL